ncbi:MAG TPA: glycosyltransferase family 2 protein [bacterium]|nr:glycosyltransferase family 2 protein [bacterium]
MLISIIFSFRNEQENLGELVNRCHNALATLNNIQYELIFVNDASTDKSLEILRNLRAKYNIKIINMSRRFGVSPCIIAGLKYAKGEAVIYMDADLQDPPELLPELIKKFQDGYDIVHTTRSKRLKENIFKIILTKYAYRLLKLISDCELPVDSGDFKLISRRALTKFLEYPEYEQFLKGIAAAVGFKQTQVYYIRQPRFSGKTHFPLLGGGPMKAFLYGVCFSDVTLQFTIILAFVLAILSFFCAAIFIISKITNLHSINILSVYYNYLFGGLLFFILAVYGLYLKKIFINTSKQPAYIIESLEGFE